MIKLKREDNQGPFTYPEDVARIVAAMGEAGYEISPHDAEWAWEKWSDSMCASWLRLDRDPGVVVAAVLEYMDPCQ